MRETTWTFDSWSRIVGFVRRDESGVVTTSSVPYGADGRLASWRSESTSAGYDAQGRHVGTSFDGDGLYFEETRLSYDVQGRLLEVANGAPPDDGDFMPASLCVRAGNPGPCQPLLMPESPPHIAWQMAGPVSADNRSFGCAP